MNCFIALSDIILHKVGLLHIRGINIRFKSWNMPNCQVQSSIIVWPLNDWMTKNKQWRLTFVLSV